MLCTYSAVEATAVAANRRTSGFSGVIPGPLLYGNSQYNEFDEHQLYKFCYHVDAETDRLADRQTDRWMQTEEQIMYKSTLYKEMPHKN